MTTPEKIFICGVEFNYETSHEPNECDYVRIMFWSDTPKIEFEMESGDHIKTDLYFIDKYDEASNTFFNENWEYILKATESIG